MNSWSCYAKLAKPQPPKSDPVWQGNEDGAIYSCFTPGIVGTKSFDRWSATGPAGPAAPPDPRVLALRATKAMQLRAVKIGIVPESRPGSIGIIGLPTWMWVAKPDQHTWGPITRTASAGGYSVTATAKVDRIVWTMGNGDTIVCRTLGTPYADSFGRKSSPDCGYRYVRQGTFTVRATSYWTVTWSGLGQTGEIPLDFAQAAIITMGEAQVITTG